jgi:hypothetical protein
MKNMKGLKRRQWSEAVRLNLVFGDAVLQGFRSGLDHLHKLHALHGKRQLGFLRRAVNSWHNFPIMVNGFCFLPATPSLKGGFALFGEKQPLLNAFHVGMEGLTFGIQESAHSADHGPSFV